MGHSGVWCNSGMITQKSPSGSGKLIRVNEKFEAQNKIERFGGVEAIEKALGMGESLSGICRQLSIDVVTLLKWIGADSERSLRIKEARRMSAVYWDDKADRVIEEAKDQFELDKAKQLVSHYRWRAKCIAPRDYGDRVQQEHTGADGGPIQTETKVTAQKVADELLKGLELQRQLKKADKK